MRCKVSVPAGYHKPVASFWGLGNFKRGETREAELTDQDVAGLKAHGLVVEPAVTVNAEKRWTDPVPPAKRREKEE